MKVWLSQDAAARALGADRVAKAMVDAGVQPIRTGSRGMVWLEPMAEVEIDGVRHAFGPLVAGDVAALMADPKGHPKALGPTDELPWMKGQTRMTFARVGVIDPLSLDDYRAHGGLKGLEVARAMPPADVVEEVTQSGLRGRGGAGFPTGIKWKTVAGVEGPKKYIVCNADEGDSGSFADRMMMEGDPLCLIEGMAIAAYAVGADKGYVYLRSEYPDAIRIMRAAADLWNRERLTPDFNVEIRVGAGAYICGEETALLNSLEGKRGTVRAKPPLPAIKGLFGKPTVVNNVITLAAVPGIMAAGAATYRDFGIGRSRGTIPLQIAGNVKYAGLYEVAFGLTLDEIVNDIAGGTASGRPVRAVQVGGPLGAYLHPSQFDVPFGYEEYDAKSALVGHAGIVVFDDTVDMAEQAEFAMEFCGIESCGKCTPCRIGAVRGRETIARIRRGDMTAKPLVTDLAETMREGSLCALGGFTPFPVISAMNLYPEDFEQVEAAQ
ncbi:MAG: formate dehydrogenase [Rubellimicrobium sp.]|nr:formate dehydrogenase [Rubellimicrobium sp.]